MTSAACSTCITSTTTTFSLTSNRLKLCHMQQLTKGLELPASAVGSYLLVTITGILNESNYDPTKFQAEFTKMEEGEALDNALAL